MPRTRPRECILFLVPFLSLDPNTNVAARARARRLDAALPTARRPPAFLFF
jgi:hypothetical protein